MHRWRSDKIGILMDFSYLWRSSQWVLLSRTAKQKAPLLKKQRGEWSNYTYLRQKLVIVSSPRTSTTYPTRMIHNSMPPESDTKIFCCKERAIFVDFQAGSCDSALRVGSDSPTRCTRHRLPRPPPPPPLLLPLRCPLPPSLLHPPIPLRCQNLRSTPPLHLEPDDEHMRIGFCIDSKTISVSMSWLTDNDPIKMSKCENFFFVASIILNWVSLGFGLLLRHSKDFRTSPWGFRTSNDHFLAFHKLND